MSTATATTISHITGFSRNISKTNNQQDYEIAASFYKKFDVANNFGELISNIAFNQWIRDQAFENMNHDWHTRDGRNAWNGHRNKIRTYIKNGVLTEEYASTGYLPYCLEIKEHGQSMIITKFEDAVMDGYTSLADKRKKTIRYQSKVLNKNFKAMTEIYNMNRIDAIMQCNIVDAQNKMRLAFEDSCGKILNSTVVNTMKSIAASENVVKKITSGLFDRHDDHDNDDESEGDEAE